MRRRRWLLLVPLLAAGCGGEPLAAECLRLDVHAERRELAATIAVDQPDEWRVVVVHEGHVAWRGVKRGPFRYTHRMKDYRGPDRVTVRASGPGGKVCTKTDRVSD